MIDMRKIGLKPREMQVLRYAMWARQTMSNGHYLVSSGQKKAAERMIERKFLTKVSNKKAGLVSFGDPDYWLVVKLTKRNVAALAEAEASRGQP